MTDAVLATLRAAARGALIVVIALAGSAVSAHAAAPPQLPGLPVGLPMPPGTASPGCVARAQPPVAGHLRLVATQALDARVTELTVYSPAMAQDVHVNVMLPVGYNPHGRRRYPVLYLYHGALGSYMDWYDNGVEQLVGRRPLIVVMPDDGVDGSYSDWYGLVEGQTGPVPAWQTFDTEELIAFVDSHYLARADRAGRFVAGLSSGGAGATKYAAADPGLFGAVGSFSGAVDTDWRWPLYPNESEALWAVTDLPGYGPDGHCTWGDPYTERVIWEDNDPTYLAENFKGTPLFLASGDGLPGPFDTASTVPDGLTEATVWQMNLAFVRALDQANVAHTDYFYGPGTHAWPYWERDLTHFLTWLGPRIGHSVPAPAAFSDRSAEPEFSAWGWSFSVSRQVREFLYLSRVGAGGLRAVGSGELRVTTAALYAPGREYSVLIGRTRNALRAGRSGRLRFVVDLGPSHTVQQSQFGPQVTRTWSHVQVRIAPARGHS